MTEIILILYLIPVLHGLSLWSKIMDELRYQAFVNPKFNLSVAASFQALQLFLWPIFMVLDTFTKREN